MSASTALCGRATWPPMTCTVIVGEEVRTAGGDLIGLFLETAVPPGMSPAETAAAIREQGGLVGLPHPVRPVSLLRRRQRRRHPDGLERLAAAVDYVEIHNARAYGSANPQAAEFAHAHGLPGVASSDSHSLMELGVAYTILPDDFSTAAELLALLRGASIVTGRASYLARLWTPVAKLVQRSRGNRRIVAGVTPVAAP